MMDLLDSFVMVYVCYIYVDLCDIYIYMDLCVIYVNSSYIIIFVI